MLFLFERLFLSMMDCGIPENGMDNQISCTPPEILEAAETAIGNLLPTKSKAIYNLAYDNFMQWRESKQIPSFSERLLLAYFNEMAERMKPSTLWSRYSMIKSVINNKHNINIGNYHQLLSLLKRKSEGFQSKKSKILTSENIRKFLNQAPDDQWPAVKVNVFLRQNVHSISIFTY